MVVQPLGGIIDGVVDAVELLRQLSKLCEAHRNADKAQQGRGLGFQGLQRIESLVGGIGIHLRLDGNLIVFADLLLHLLHLGFSGCLRGRVNDEMYHVGKIGNRDTLCCATSHLLLPPFVCTLALNILPHIIKGIEFKRLVQRIAVF